MPVEFFRWRKPFPSDNWPSPWADGRAFPLGSHYSGKDQSFVPGTRHQIYHGRPWLGRASVYAVTEDLMTTTVQKLLALEEFVSDTERWILCWDRPIFRRCFRQQFFEFDGKEDWWVTEYDDAAWPIAGWSIDVNTRTRVHPLPDEFTHYFRLGRIGAWNDSLIYTSTVCRAEYGNPPLTFDGWVRFNYFAWLQNGCWTGSDATRLTESPADPHVPAPADETERSEIVAALSGLGYLFDAERLFIETS